MEVTVTEIHEYPLRPEGFVEPLFATSESRSEIAQHLLHAPWLSRASEIEKKSGRTTHTAHTACTAHKVEEPVKLQRDAGDSVEILRPHGPHTRRCSWRRRRIVEVLERWREVSSWWSDDDPVDRLLFRVVVAGRSPSGHSLSGDAIVDLAVDRSGAWTLTGVVD